MLIAIKMEEDKIKRKMEPKQEILENEQEPAKHEEWVLSPRDEAKRTLNTSVDVDKPLLKNENLTDLVKDLTENKNEPKNSKIEKIEAVAEVGIVTSIIAGVSAATNGAKNEAKEVLSELEIPDEI